MVGSLKDLKSVLNGTINSTKNNKLKSNVDDSVKTINTLKKAMNFGVIAAGLKKGWNIAKDLSNEYINMVETNNLFEVSMGKVVDQYGNLDEVQSQYYTKAINFQNEMNEKLATNRSELMKYQAMYYSMFNSQLGASNKDKSYLMSESLTKAGYDIASLYNLSVDEAMTKIKSGIAGQVEPLRTIGIDISESALQKVLNERDIDKSVQQLSYAEKEVARYIAIIEQAGQAQGDFARTFESPANQLRVFKNQLAELRQVAGAFIINTFGNILTYANAIIMVIKEILKSFANLFGYDLNIGGSLGSASGTIDDIGTGLGSAVGKAKELKKQLMGFDEINNIDPPTQTGGNSGSGGVGGIDSKLLGDLKEWDNKMSDISGKAQRIRDAMLSWLGFERDDDGTWHLKDGLTNFEKIKRVVEGIGIAFGAWKVLDLLKNLGANIPLKDQLRITAGITLTITSLKAYFDSKTGLKDGNITNKELLTSVASIIGAAVGVGLLTKSIPLSLILAAGLTVDLMDTIGNENLWYPIKKALDLDFFNKNEAGKSIKLAIDITSFDLWGIEKIFGEDFANTIKSRLLETLKNILIDVAKGIEKVPVIGKSISTGIISAVNAFQPDTQSGIESSVNNSLTNSQNVIDATAQNSGMQAMLNYKQGISSKQYDIQNATQGINNTVTNQLNSINTNGVGQKVVNNVAQDINNNKGGWNLTNALENVRNTITNYLKKPFNFEWSLPKNMKLPRFSWTTTPASGWIASTLSALNLPTSLPKLNVSWYAQGGMPDIGELFVARESGPEMVGKIGNKTTVANNDQIVTAIKQGVYEAMINAMANENNKIQLDVRVDEGIIFKKVQSQAEEFVMQTGESPFPTPA